jgi:hypothetical protein
VLKRVNKLSTSILPKPPSILTTFGFESLAFEKGVYHLRRMNQNPPNIIDSVGLLFSAEPITTNANLDLMLLVYDIEPSIPAAPILKHWQTLDARRLEESGIYPRTFSVGREYVDLNQTIQEYARPYDGRVRYAVVLTSGDVVCYN